MEPSVQGLPDQTLHGAGRTAPFPGKAERIDLNHDPGAWSSPGDLGHQSRTIHGLPDRHPVGQAPNLIALDTTDNVPRHFPASQSVVFGQDFLSVILSHCIVPGSQYRFYGLRPKCLGHREEASPSSTETGQPFLEVMDTVSNGCWVDRKTVHGASSRMTTIA